MMLLGRRAECEFLDTVLADALAGRSRVAVLRGEAGAGKSSLLDFAAERATGWRVATAVGIESEMELAYSGLHQLCAPMLDCLDRLPAPQCRAMATVFGHEAGPPPDRFLVGLATLTLLAEVADQQPLLCLIDDAQWLDDASAQIFLFVSRRLLAERIALVCAVRTGGDEVLGGLPTLMVPGLSDSDARALLLNNLRGPLDAAVCEQLINESHGNPLALLELPRTWTITDVAGGFGLPAHQSVASRVEQSFAKRLLRLPGETQLIVLAAAAEPLGDPLLLHRAAEILDLDLTAAGPAVDAGLLDTSAQIEFAHPLIRSAAYRAATAGDRRRVHSALAEATDPDRDPDRRAWHRARATPAPDEEIAAELERSAGRAQARGGIAAAAAFLGRAAALSPDLGTRARRSLAAAEAKQLAGAPQAASTLLAAAADGPLDELESALAQRLRGQIALDQRRGGEALPFLLDAARRLSSLEPNLARDTYMDAMRAGSIGGRFSGEMLHQAAEAARNAQPPEEQAGRSSGLLLAGLAVRFTDGYAASANLLKRALQALCEEGGRVEQVNRWPGFARRVAFDLFDDEAAHVITLRSVELAREQGALGVLPLALDFMAIVSTLEGDLDAADARLEESDAIADATGTARIGAARLTLAGYRGNESALTALLDAGEPVAISRGEGVVLTFGEHARALLYNGLGNYKAALDAAESASGQDELGVSVWSLPELVEAAMRSGKTEFAGAALERLTERTRAAGTDWALGIEARSRALLGGEMVIDELYLEAIQRLSRCRIAPEEARAHLVYGESLRRAGRRVDAREQLRVAHSMFAAMGMQAFAERARRELAATGEKVRRHQATAMNSPPRRRRSPNSRGTATRTPRSAPGSSSARVPSSGTCARFSRSSASALAESSTRLCPTLGRRRPSRSELFA
jgi:hypothetical protein